MNRLEGHELERKAFRMAVMAHDGHAYGGDPYVVHLFDVANVVRAFDPMAYEVIAAAWLHDILEDTAIKYHDVVREIGSEIVANIVYAVTDELGRNRRERIERTIPKIVASSSAMLVKLADMLSNVRTAVRMRDDRIQMYRKEAPLWSVHRDRFGEYEGLWAELDALLDQTSAKTVEMGK